MPLECDFRSGISHLNNNPDQEEFFSVVRAFATFKVHYLKKLEQRPELNGLSFRDEKFFCKAFPVLLGTAIEYAAPAHPVWAVIRDKYRVTNVFEFLKCLFNKHDGEARLIGQPSWTLLDGDVRDPQFWSYQFATTEATRRWLALRHPDEMLTWEHVNWILDHCDGRTLLIKRVRAAPGAPPFSRFFKRSGRVVTLPEMTYLGVDLCTCFDIYKLYLDLPLFCHRRDPPGTHGAKKKRARTMGVEGV